GVLTNSVGIAGLVIKSDATGTGSLITSSTPTATVERYLTNYASGTDKKYHFISSPVDAQSIREEFVANSPLSTVDFYKFDEPTYFWINTKTDIGAWNPAFESNFVVGRGYMVAYPTEPVTKTFTGNLNSYTSGLPLTLTLTNTTGKGEGWNLLGNPFPSAIDWDIVTKGNGMDNALYYYDAAYENYRYYIQLGTVGSIGSGSRYIPAMQGFMVHAKSTGTKTITISNDNRVHSGQILYKSGEAAPWSLSLKVNSSGFEDAMFVHFNSAATTQFDGKYDAYKLTSYNTQVPQIYTMSSDESKLAINGLPTLAEGLEIPVFFKAGVNGQQTITADVSQAMSTVFLTDLKTSATQNLRLNPTYSFTSGDGDAANRFLLRFAAVGINETTIVQPIAIYTAGNAICLSSKTGASLKGDVFVYNMMGQLILHQPLSENPLTRLNFGQQRKPEPPWRPH
ncbi:MAG: hypothetical protein NT004_11515, partial [Bacteroidetes bacterium]|nr:hypothetical protein [Bacteroidota bacterium]